MTYGPIALTLPEYDRNLYKTYWLKAYDQGTTTPLSMATDATGGTLLAKVQLDSQGFPNTTSGVRFIPFIQGDYDLWLFPNDLEADADFTANAIQLADNLNTAAGTDAAATLTTNLAASSGDSLVGHISDAVGATARTVQSALRDSVHINEFAPAADGATDDSAKFILARDTNKPVELEAGKTYAIGSQITATAHGQGFVCSEGVATILMLTGAGKFDRVDYSGTQWDSDACGFYGNGFDDYRLTGVKIQMETNAGVRTAKALSLRNSERSRIDIEVTGFQETEDGITSFDSLRDCDIDVYAHDCGTTDDTLATMQITAVEIDNNSALVDTQSTRVMAHGKNITITGAALTKYNAQTDGVNVAGTGDKHGLVIECNFENVGECFDCFGSYVIARVQGKTIGLSGVKLIHGAQHCIVDAVIHDTYGPAVHIVGTSTGTQQTAFNIVRATVGGVGDVAGSGGLLQTAVWFDGVGETYLCNFNHVEIVAADAGNMDSIAEFYAGANNTVVYTYDNTQTVLQAVYRSTAGVGNRATDRNAGRGGYAASRYYGGGFIDLALTSTIAIIADNLYAVPFNVNELETFVTIGTRITAGSAGLMRLGIYTWEAGGPDALIIDVGTVDTTSAAVVEASINAGAGIALTPGMYCLAAVSNATPTVYATPSTSKENVNLIGVGTPGGTANARIRSTLVYAALPSAFGTYVRDNASIPNIWLRS